MFTCFQNPTQKIPQHLAVKADPSWIQEPHSISGLIDWCLERNVAQLSFFTVTPSTDPTLLEFIMQLNQNDKITWYLISTNSLINSNIKVKLYQLRFACAILKIYIYIDYQFQERLEHLRYGTADALTIVPSKYTEPEFMIITGRQTNMTATPLDKLENTSLLFIATKFIYCDDEVWDDCMEHFT